MRRTRLHLERCTSWPWWTSSAARIGRPARDPTRHVVGSTDTAPLVARFGASLCTAVRHRVAGYSARAGLAGQQLDDFVLAIYELLTDVVRRQGGGGWLRLWRHGDHLVCEIRKAGYGTAGAGHRPARSTSSSPDRPAPLDGVGVWLARQLTEIVHVQSRAEVTTVRVRMRLRPR